MRIATLCLTSAVALAGCVTTPETSVVPVPPAVAEPDPANDMGIRWVKHAAEYHAITRQVYASATVDLPGFIADTSWSALPQQSDAGELPPAVILDVDETVVSNVDFQLSFERPFTNEKHEAWIRATPATPIQGFREFIEAARAQGVEVFFVTNRPCAADGDDPCPQRQSTIDDIADTGIVTDAEHVFLSEERGWTREKLSRRLHVAETHRVIMLFGDDYGDFVHCSRRSPSAPCSHAATRDSRLQALDTYDHYWGHGWYILPNPMHGSWTSFDSD